MNYVYLQTPIGALLVAGDEAGLRYVGFPTGKGRVEPAPDWRQDASTLQEPLTQLAAYFAGERTDFDLTLAPTGTPFQLQVLEALQTIPYGQTRSYAEIAAQIGRPQAVRAVGAANGRNPIPVIIPCHRVIGASGKLVGFGGGLASKQFLLNLEAGDTQVVPGF